MRRSPNAQADMKPMTGDLDVCAAAVVGVTVRGGGRRDGGAPPSRTRCVTVS